MRELASLERFLAGGLEGDEDGAGAGGRRPHLRAQPRHGEQPGTEASRRAEEVAASMRASAPAVQSFAMGRRR